MGRRSNKERDWLNIRLSDDPKGKRKTDIWEVERRDQPAFPLGFIKWHGAWRKYCFFPEPDTLFDPNCLRQIANFMQHATRNRGLG